MINNSIKKYTNTPFHQFCKKLQSTLTTRLYYHLHLKLTKLSLPTGQNELVWVLTRSQRKDFSGHTLFNTSSSSFPTFPWISTPRGSSICYRHTKSKTLGRSNRHITCGNFDPFSYWRVNLGYLLSRTGKIKKIKWKGGWVKYVERVEYCIEPLESFYSKSLITSVMIIFT